MKTSRLSLLSGTFHAGIAIKGIDGLLEAIGGILVWVIKPSELSGIVHFLFQHELSRDPHDWVATHLLNATTKLANADPTFASIFLLSHGVTKIVLVLCLWINKLWAYPLTIFVFTAFGTYQTYRFTHTHSLWLLLLTVFDIVLIFLTWEEFQVQKGLRAQKTA